MLYNIIFLESSMLFYMTCNSDITLTLILNPSKINIKEKKNEKWETKLKYLESTILNSDRPQSIVYEIN